MPARSQAKHTTSKNEMPSKKRTQQPTPEPETPAPTPVEPPPPPKRQRKKKEAPASEVSSVAPSVATTTASVTIKKAKRKKSTKKSTRTPSSYVLFSMEERKSIIQKSPDLSLGEVSKKCGQVWKTLTDAQKAPWQKKADELKQKRMAEIAEEEKINPPKKKRAPSSYLLFAMEHRKVILEKEPALAIGDVSKRCGAVWKAMSDGDKQTWKDKAATLKEAQVNA